MRQHKWDSQRTWQQRREAEEERKKALQEKWDKRWDEARKRHSVRDKVKAKNSNKAACIEKGKATGITTKHGGAFGRRKQMLDHRAENDRIQRELKAKDKSE